MAFGFIIEMQALIIDFFNFLCYNASKKAEKAGLTLLNKR